MQNILVRKTISHKPYYKHCVYLLRKRNTFSYRCYEGRATIRASVIECKSTLMPQNGNQFVLERIVNHPGTIKSSMSTIFINATSKLLLKPAVKLDYYYCYQLTLKLESKNHHNKNAWQTYTTMFRVNLFKKIYLSIHIKSSSCISEQISVYVRYALTRFNILMPFRMMMIQVDPRKVLILEWQIVIKSSPLSLFNSFVLH